MSSNRIILYDGKFEAEKAEEELLERRNNILQGLESARMAMVQFLGREMEYSDLEPFINQTKADERKEMALKLWLEVTNQTVPKMFVKLSSAILTPPEVTKLLEGIVKMDEWRSEAPKRYWNEKAKVFEVVPVSKEDKDILIERYRVYCANGVDPEFAKFVLQYVRMMNFGNKFYTRIKGGTSPDSEDFPKFLRPIVEVKKHFLFGDRRQFHCEYRLKDNTLTIDGKHGLAFDEYKSSSIALGKDSFTSIDDLKHINVAHSMYS